MISEAFEDDTGRYTCVASNSLGADNTSAEVYIEGQMFLYEEIIITSEAFIYSSYTVLMSSTAQREYCFRTHNTAAILLAQLSS